MKDLLRPGRCESHLMWLLNVGRRPPGLMVLECLPEVVSENLASASYMCRWSSAWRHMFQGDRLVMGLIVPAFAGFQPALLVNKQKKFCCDWMMIFQSRTECDECGKGCSI